jgi:prevent-host-death family protein
MTRVTAAEFQRAFGPLSDKAAREPLTITKHGRDHLVLMAADEYARLKRRDRRVFAAAELTAEEIAAFEKVQMHPRHENLNAELDEPAS